MAHRKMEMLRARKRLKDREIVFGQREKVRQQRRSGPFLTVSDPLKTAPNQLWHDFSRSQEEQQAKFQKKVHPLVKMHP